MKLHATPLPGLTLVENSVVADQRGRFQRVFCADALAAVQPGLRTAQANLSLTRGRGSLRGLHFQSPPAQESKLVRCLHGRVFDVAVDLRSRSPTFMQWHAVELSGDAPFALFLPAGFAHGFQVLGDEAELLYFHDAAWAPDHEGGLRYDDPRLAIRWPLPAGQVSPRDRQHPLIEPDFPGMDL